MFHNRGGPESWKKGPYHPRGYFAEAGLPAPSCRTIRGETPSDRHARRLREALDAEPAARIMAAIGGYLLEIRGEDRGVWEYFQPGASPPMVVWLPASGRALVWRPGLVDPVRLKVHCIRQAAWVARRAFSGRAGMGVLARLEAAQVLRRHSQRAFGGDGDGDPWGGLRGEDA